MFRVSVLEPVVHVGVPPQVPRMQTRFLVPVLQEVDHDPHAVQAALVAPKAYRATTLTVAPEQAVPWHEGLAK